MKEYLELLDIQGVLACLGRQLARLARLLLEPQDGLVFHSRPVDQLFLVAQVALDTKYLHYLKR